MLICPKKENSVGWEWEPSSFLELKVTEVGAGFKKKKQKNRNTKKQKIPESTEISLKLRF